MFHVKHTRLFLSFSRLRIIKIELFMFHVKRGEEFHGKMIVSRETSGAKFRTKHRKTERNATDEGKGSKKIWHLHKEDAIS